MMTGMLHPPPLPCHAGVVRVVRVVPDVRSSRSLSRPLSRPLSTSTWRAALPDVFSTNDSPTPCSPVVSTAGGQDVGVFGAGAAGMAAAYFASKDPNVVVTVYEKTSEAGKKIKASGGSRCNVLPNPHRDPPVNIETDVYVPSSTKKGAVRALLASWDLQSCREWLEQDIGIPLKLEEDADKMFPQSDSGAEVRDKLLEAVVRHQNARIEMGAELVGIEIEPVEQQIGSAGGTAGGTASSSQRFRCTFSDGSQRTHSRVVLATGGKSFAALGTTGMGYDILRRLGVDINEPRPALTPLLFSRKDNALVQLAGVSLQHAVMTVSYRGDWSTAVDDSTRRNGRNGGGSDGDHNTMQTHEKPKKKKKKSKPTVRHAVRGQSLITHRGMSGPDAMDLSGFSNLPREANVTYRISWSRDLQTPSECDAFLAQALQTNPKKTVRSVLATALPTSLATFLCDAANIDQHTNISSLKKADREHLIQLMTAYDLDIGKNEGFAKAEVSSGGVPLQALDLATMELRDVPGLHVIGELVDVHGRIGGFNFLLAWIEGRLAGRAIAGRP